MASSCLEYTPQCIIIDSCIVQLRWIYPSILICAPACIEGDVITLGHATTQVNIDGVFYCDDDKSRIRKRHAGWCTDVRCVQNERSA